MKKIILSFFLVLVSVGIVTVFQNCGNVKVDQRASTAPEISYAQSKPSGYFCSDVGPNYTTPLKILFVVDMSLSNLGGELVYQVAAAGTDTFRHTLGTFYKDAVLSGSGLPGFNLSSAMSPFSSPLEKANSIVVSDKDGNRFQAMRNFVDPASVCSKIGTNFTYSTVGFADNFMIPKGDPIQTCESPFVDATAFTSQIDGLKKYQDLDLNPAMKVRSGGPESPYQMGDTNYRKGLICMDTKIQRDALYGAEELPFYYVIFLSDGMATDKYDPCAGMYSFDPKFKSCVTDNKLDGCYTIVGYTVKPDYACINKVVIPGILSNLKTQIEPIAAGFKFQPVFYWPSGQAGNDYEKALQVMQPLAQLGGVPGVLKLEDTQSMLDLQKTVCSTIDSSMKVSYSIQSYMAVNLTARMQKGILKADSDADGITDEEEAQLEGFSNVGSRSKSGGKILDSICNLVGESACATTLACDAGKFLGVGFSECDQKVLAAYSGNEINGVDSDADGLLDLVELVKGSNPIVSDADTVTPTGDQKLVSQVIAGGYDLQSNNLKFPPKAADLFSAEFTYEKGAPECGSNKEEMNVVLENIPLVSVAAFNDGQSGPLSLSHEKDENVVLITYRVSPVGGLAGDDHIYVMILHVGLNGVVKESITPSSFVLFSGAKL